MAKSGERARVAFYCACIFIAVTILVVLLLVRTRRETQLCFALDILRERVPHRSPEPLHRPMAAAPFAVGRLCFDAQQQLAEWHIEDTFQFSYDTDRLADLRLHGPMPQNSSVAPVVFDMGLRRDKRHRFSGSTVTDIDTIAAMSMHPELYYVA